MQHLPFTAKQYIKKALQTKTKPNQTKQQQQRVDDFLHTLPRVFSKTDVLVRFIVKSTGYLLSCRNLEQKIVGSMKWHFPIKLYFAGSSPSSTKHYGFTSHANYRFASFLHDRFQNPFCIHKTWGNKALQGEHYKISSAFSFSHRLSCRHR